MRGKLTEGVKRGFLFTNRRLTGTTTTDYYNGISASDGSAVGIDTNGYEDFDAILMPGSLLGEALTIDNTLIAGANNNPFAATAIAGAAFATLNRTTGGSTMREGAVLAKNQSRYVFLKTTVQTASSIPYTADFGAMYTMGRAKSQPVTKTLDFDV
jgi:hypothetical protein